MTDISASLFITCLVDQLYPQVGECMVKILHRLGVNVSFNPQQTCCGQPAFNTGYRKYACELGQRFLTVFSDSEYIVAPSGSCVSMVKHYYPDLFKGDPELLRQAQEVGDRTYEFSDFLVNILKVDDVGATYHGRVTYHDGCHLLRELRIKDEPRRLIRNVRGITFVEMDNADQCCGFGGTFSIKMADISAAMVTDKIDGIKRARADVVVANDCSCLMQIAGALSRQGSSTATMHLAELLASEV